MGENDADWRKDPKKRSDLIKKMARLLEDGHRMLDEVCPKCGTILFFRKDVGLKFCPNCEIFLATPEEISKMNKNRVEIIGEYIGGKIVEVSEDKKKGVLAAKKLPIEKNKRIKAIGVGGDILMEIDEILRMIIQKIKERIVYEFDRLSLMDAFEVLKLIFELKLKISEDNG